jgi:hypothetical protein
MVEIESILVCYGQNIELQQDVSDGISCTTWKLKFSKVVKFDDVQGLETSFCTGVYQ